MGFLSVPTNQFSELELWLISFAGSHCTSIWQGGGKRRREGRWVGGGSIIPMRLIEGRLFFKEILYMKNWTLVLDNMEHNIS